MQVKSTVLDEGPTTASGIAAVRAALNSKNYDVLVGVANSDVLAAVANDVTAARIPLLGTNGSPAQMQTSPFIWRTSFVAGEASRALANYLVGVAPGKSPGEDLLKPSSVVVYHDGTSDSESEAKAFSDTLGSTSITIYPVTGSPSAPGTMSQIASWQPDLVYAAVGYASTADFITQYRKANINVGLCGPGSLTEQSKQVAGAKGIFTSMNYGPDLDSEANETFTSNYLARFASKIPTTYAMTTYDAGAVLSAALASLDPDEDVDGQAINTSLGSPLAFDSPRGRWQFNQARTPLQQWYLRQVRLDGSVLDNVVLAGLETLT
jgi:branched-chain amino acid transport system substrate-binding protein